MSGEEDDPYKIKPGVEGTNQQLANVANALDNLYKVFEEGFSEIGRGLYEVADATREPGNAKPTAKKPRKAKLKRR